MLVFFYTGFIIGTVFCALAPTYHFLLAARIFTGIFGGVISSISFAIITDTFPMERRGTVMGFVQMAFAASQILGIPLGLFLANKFNWHAPFVMVAVVALVVLLLIIKGLNPINEHLKLKNESNPILHLWNTFKNVNYLRAFLTTSLKFFFADAKSNSN
jgi:predicted MFS family arabinose efflux permease